ncbi:hypothetical protein CQ018_16960 [Arthrobacter sp. MYb227]|uniref:LytR C-terminal domain-containing protein n=1 Tax=Arthrobacter sp. MYb227 TaxID=1848601 RepID=UPI000CFB966C|nr:LytR C-terminal domain-containing protein [Arthrobacter sp. MYb227]PQZ88136.1 hypothetical protein CQ018_16960 [Arthrobacter sp. MYb227]
MTNYPRDEFDRVPEFSNRSGSHRANGWAAAAATSGVRPSLRWLMVFGVLALLVGVFSFTVLPKLTGGGNNPPPVAGASSAPSQSPSADTGGSEPTGEGSATPSEDPTESAGPSESDDPAASESPDASASTDASGVDYSQAIGVFNGAQRAGIAGTVRTTLLNAGFTNVAADTWTKKVTYSTIYYADPSYKAVAEKAGEELGITSLIQTNNIPGKVAVVLGTSWR